MGSCCRRSSLLPGAKTCKLSLLSAIFGACKPLADCVSLSAAVATCPNGSVREWAGCPMVSTTSDGWSGCCTTLCDVKTRGIALLTRSSTACKPVFSASQRSAACLCDPVLRCSGVPTLPISPRRWPGCCRRSPESKTVYALFLSSHAALAESCQLCKNRFLRFTCKIDSDSGTFPCCCKPPIASESESG